jgi:hypothetical protein
MRMCQVFRGKIGLVDHCVDLGGERVEGVAERGCDRSEGGQSGGQAGTQEAIVGSSKEQGDAHAEVGDLVVEAFWDALDQAMEAKSAQLVSYCA